jgi:hypothetical protein
LQDQMQPFHTSLANVIVRRELSSKSLSAKELEDFVSSLSASPVAAVSIGQVHSGTLPNKQKVAMKVQRPGIRETEEEDTELLIIIVRLVESIPAIPRLQKGQDRLISTDLSGAVEEFVSRIFKEQRIRGTTRGTNGIVSRGSQIHPAVVQSQLLTQPREGTIRLLRSIQFGLTPGGIFNQEIWESSRRMARGFPRFDLYFAPY